MKRALLLLTFLLAACAAPAAQTSEFLENSEVSTPTPTPNPSTLTGTSPMGRGESAPSPTPTLTPLPSFSRAELDSMDEAQKIAQAPSVDEMPADLRDVEVQWSEPVIAEAGWGTLIQYSGADENGNEVNAYYDLENGAWVKRYESLDQVAQIPADQIPAALVVGDEVLTSKVRVNYQWSVPPESVAQGWQVFRDASGDAQTVYDPNADAWLSPEQAGMVFMPISNEERKDGKYIEYEVGDDFEGFMAQLIAAEKEALQSGKFVIPEKSKNYGWTARPFPKEANYDGNYIEPIFNVTDGGEPDQLLSVGILDGKIFGSKYAGRKFGMVGFAVKNPDGTIGILHGATLKGLPFFYFYNSGVRRIPSFYGGTRVLNTDKTNEFWYRDLVNQFQGGKVYKQGLLQQLIDDEKQAQITPEMEAILFFFLNQ
ncbi:MAG: hypothetical protein LC099_07810 [Anaerolineales bacterium]|nr:hypothetical protein [Anaerolineales bacterium]